MRAQVLALKAVFQEIPPPSLACVCVCVCTRTLDTDTHTWTHILYCILTHRTRSCRKSTLLRPMSAPGGSPRSRPPRPRRCCSRPAWLYSPWCSEVFGIFLRFSRFFDVSRKSHAHALSGVARRRSNGGGCDPSLYYTHSSPQHSLSPRGSFLTSLVVDYIRVDTHTRATSRSIFTAFCGVPA